MSVTTCIITLLFLNVHTHVQTIEVNVTETSVQLYEKGVDAYLENRWEECVGYFEKALGKYRKYRKKIQSCRLKCKNEAQYSEPLYPVDIENLLFFERAVRQTLCLIECENNDPEILENYNVNLEMGNLFEEQRPYEYLHICYFQTNQLVKAASSAFTYLVAHPDNKIMAGNLKHYIDHNVDKKEIVNYEAKDYVYLYVHGADAYENKDWKYVIFNMEDSLVEYLQAEEECRAQCEGPFDHGWYPDFIPSISNHFTVCLKCKQKCRTTLSSLNGEIYNDLLPSHYHYLQYAYYKTGNLKAACQAVASYLLFYSDDETMLDNMRYYSKQPKVQDDYFHPRKEATRYVQRQIYENRILKFVNKEFSSKLTTKIKTEDLKKKLYVTMTEKELKGSKRIVIDGLATAKECKTLMEIAKYFAILGDGYEGKKSPHTNMEKFEGITLSRTLFLTYFKMLRPKYLEIFLGVTENARKYIKKYFKIKKKLHFSFTHLVCRTTLPDSPKNRTDFSHKIHADNCNILKNQTCVRSFPAFTWRDYSAILYLNDDFEGGEFIFSSDPSGLDIQSSIRPTCGRLLAFSSGPENLHGVKAVKGGSRCAIGIWFTHDPKYADKDRNLARNVLDQNLDFHLDPSIDITGFNLDFQKDNVPGTYN